MKKTYGAYKLIIVPLNLYAEKISFAFGKQILNMSQN